MSHLNALFSPRAVAIIGASTKELSIGNVITKNLQTYGYRGAIYPINPSAPDIRGITAYKSLAEIPGEVDLAHIIIPSSQVPQAMEECGRKGVKAVIINSAGFSEMGEDGARLQTEFLATAQKYGVRVFGPNCQGIINSDPQLKAYCNFTFTYPEPGYISVVALSGGVGALIMQALADLGIGQRLYASNGNASDVSISEIIRYYGQDEGTRAVILYTEGFSNPREFLEVAREVAAKKPILAMKAGRTEQGAKAASSHTGSLAGVDIATELIFEKTGILSFTDEGEMARAAMAFATQPIPKGNRVGIITNTGGPAVIATDVLVSCGLDVPKISESSIERLKGTQLPEAALENPIDVVATAGGPQFRGALDVLIDEESVDSIFINFVTAPFTDTQEVARQIVEVSRLARKPIVCNFMTDLSQERFQITRDILKQGGVPFYANPSDAAKALGALTKYGRIRQREIGRAETFAVDAARAKRIIDQAKEAGRSVLSATDVYTVFEAYGIPVAPWRVVDSADEAVAAAGAIGFPVVVKVDCEEIDHKSDMGGVAINLKDGAAVRATVEDMRSRLGKFGRLRFFVQKFLPGGRELIIGATAERELGHLVMFGLGGIYVEVLKDVAFKIAPVTRLEAGEMLSSIKTAALLDGVRGEKGVDKEGIVNLIQRVSQLLTDLPMIQEMDMNPIMAFEDAVYAVDGRIRI
ncbi:acetate--CoA ligase family protein [Geobacter hydrogenophilus]|uniref:Acyl-CoA synthetase n=1 Tax=Geobacter hydrogenophilus TaxID=40983 RepID=A0A9W6LCD0_9BACT|nr:acetate--CoA ligase [Geobacter hydrogenophilus]MBT0893520.1 acetate--CoA ligase family protein [Geobacter hydrogenophilus]GLI37785.1 acyl-CoA synthetase [Geobacter hydrogenophilus]